MICTPQTVSKLAKQGETKPAPLPWTFAHQGTGFLWLHAPKTRENAHNLNFSHMLQIRALLTVLEAQSDFRSKQPQKWKLSTLCPHPELVPKSPGKPSDSPCTINCNHDNTNPCTTKQRHLKVFLSRAIAIFTREAPQYMQPQQVTKVHRNWNRHTSHEATNSNLTLIKSWIA